MIAISCVLVVSSKVVCSSVNVGASVGICHGVVVSRRGSHPSCELRVELTLNSH